MLRFKVTISNSAGEMVVDDTPAANYVDAVDYALEEAQKQGLDVYHDEFTVTVVGSLS